MKSWCTRLLKPLYWTYLEKKKNMGDHFWRLTTEWYLPPYSKAVCKSTIGSIAFLRNPYIGKHKISLLKRKFVTAELLEHWIGVNKVKLFLYIVYKDIKLWSIMAQADSCSIGCLLFVFAHQPFCNSIGKKNTEDITQNRSKWQIAFKINLKRFLCLDL